MNMIKKRSKGVSNKGKKSKTLSLENFWRK